MVKLYYRKESFTMDFNSNQINTTSNRFAIASIVCGILALIACCMGILAVPFGALGVIFAVLSKRKGQNMPGMSTAGIWLSCVGMALGILFTIYSFYIVFNTPAMLEEVNRIFESIYGMSIEEYYMNIPY